MAQKLVPSAIPVNSKGQDPVKTIMEATDGLGVDVAIELSGNLEGIKQAFKVLKRKGRVGLPLADYAKAIELAAKAEAGKVLLYPE
jgi:threonine dehydrogenase-like Zn-dependent dehydrogenase